MKRIYMLFFAVCLLVLPACGQTTDKAYALMLEGMYSNKVPLLKPSALKQQLTAKGLKPVLLDTRTPEEYKVSHLAGARFVPYKKFDAAMVKDVPKDSPIVVYCSVGYRSERIGEQLQKAGYKNVQNLYGGIFEWVNQGYPVYNKVGQTSQVHAYSKAWGVWLQKGDKVYE